MAYAASLLRKHNIDVRIIDAIAEHIPETLFIEKISKINFDYLVAETSIPSFFASLSNNLRGSAIYVSISDSLTCTLYVDIKPHVLSLCSRSSEILAPRFDSSHISSN